MVQPHSFSSIPVIDLAQASTPAGRSQLLKALHHALTSVGFLYVANHGVPKHVVADMVALLPKLFNLSEAEKQEIALEKSPHFLGYSNVGSETTAGKRDLREQFEFATELENTWSSDQPLYDRLRGPNQVGAFSLLDVNRALRTALITSSGHRHFQRLGMSLRPMLQSLLRSLYGF